MAATRLVWPATRQRFWLRADPVHLRPERDALVLIDASQLH
jgi:hypothetical protein